MKLHCFCGAFVSSANCWLEGHTTWPMIWCKKCKRILGLPWPLPTKTRGGKEAGSV